MLYLLGIIMTCLFDNKDRKKVLIAEYFLKIFSGKCEIQFLLLIYQE